MPVQDARVTRAIQAIEAWLTAKKYGGVADWAGKFRYNTFDTKGTTLIFHASNPSGKDFAYFTSGQVIEV